MILSPVPTTHRPVALPPGTPDALAATLSPILGTITALSDAVLILTANQDTIAAALHALSKRAQEAASAASAANNNDDLDAVRSALRALTTDLSNLRVILDLRCSELDRKLATFNQAERYAITRAMVSRIMAETAPAHELASP